MGGRGDEDAEQSVAEVRSEVPHVSGDEVRRSCGHRSTQNRPVLFGQIDSFAIIRGDTAAGSHLKPIQETIQPQSLIVVGEVATGFSHGVLGRQQHGGVEFPEACDTRLGTIGGRKEDVGVEKETIHPSAFIRRLVRYARRVDSKLAHLFESLAVVLSVDGVSQDELGLALWTVELDGNGHRRP